MYKIVISLCLLIPAIANLDDYNLLKLMQSALDHTFTDSIDLLKTQVDVAQKDVDSILSTVPLQDPFLLDLESPPEDPLIEITLPAALGSNQYEVEKDSEPANKCAEFLTKNFPIKKEEVLECSDAQLRVVSSYKEKLLNTFDTTLKTFELFKSRSIKCDRNSTTIIENMVDALCVRKIELEVRNAIHEAGELFSSIVRDVRKIRKTWTRNLLDCLTRNKEPTAALEYSQACKFKLESDYNSRKT